MSTEVAAGRAVRPVGAISAVRGVRGVRGAALTLALLGSLLAACSSTDARSAPDSCADLEVTISGTDGDDRLRGTPGRDVVDAAGGDDVVRGLGGDDVLCGGEGADRLRGGDGDDVVDGGADLRYEEDAEYFQWAGDSLDGGLGDDQLLTGPRDDHEPVDELVFSDAAGPVVVDLPAGTATGGAGSDTVVGEVASVLGSSYDDRIVGTGRPERLMGGRGGDVLLGGGGADDLQAVGQADQFFGETPLREDEPGDRNVVRGGGGADELSGGPARDVMAGGDGNDILNGDAGADRLLGGPGRDQVSDTAVGAAPGQPTPDGQLLDGGPGRDLVGGVFLGLPAPTRYDTTYTDATGTLDLAAGRLVATADAPEQGPQAFGLPVRGFEDAQTSPGRWTVYGTDGPNEVLAFDERRPIVIHARGGDDDLAGSFRADLLDGGPGVDSATGYTGADRYVSIERRG